MTLKSWKVGEFHKRTLPKGVAGPAGDRAEVTGSERRSRVDGAAEGEGPVSRSRGGLAPPGLLAHSSSCWAVGCLLIKSTEVGLLLELRGTVASGSGGQRKTLPGPLLLSSQVEAVGKGGLDSWAWRFLLKFSGPCRSVILTSPLGEHFWGSLETLAPQSQRKHPQFPSCV